jgi:16S rRNA (guanine527-N7)-methyltransferase
MFHVKHHANIEPEAVRAALKGVGVCVTTAQCRLLAAHAELVLDANARMNLTRITEPDEVIQLHIVDSLAYLPLLTPLQSPIVDIGSGAGFPGIPLAALGHEVALCESVRKKAEFLAEAVTELGLECRVLPLRAEELAMEAPAAYRTVTARAVSALGALVELAAPLLGAGGRLVALKGQPSAEELMHAEGAAAICGMSLVVSQEYQLPTGQARSVFCYERAGRPSIKLPRRPGMAQRRPLGVEGT